jgi:P-type Cu+ transporter
VEAAAAHVQAVEQEVITVTATFAVAGMTCASCVRAIEKGFTKTVGVQSVTVSLPMNTAEVQFDAARIGTAEIAHAIKKCGFRATLLPAHTGILL